MSNNLKQQLSDKKQPEQTRQVLVRVPKPSREMMALDLRNLIFQGSRRQTQKTRGLSLAGPAPAPTTPKSGKVSLKSKGKQKLKLQKFAPLINPEPNSYAQPIPTPIAIPATDLAPEKPSQDKSEQLAEKNLVEPTLIRQHKQIKRKKSKKILYQSDSQDSELPSKRRRKPGFSHLNRVFHRADDQPSKIKHKNMHTVLLERDVFLMDLSLFGKFEIIMVNLLNNPSYRFSDLIQLRLEKLSDKGFMFVWIQTDFTNPAYSLLQQWGYQVVDQLIWVQLFRDQLTSRQAGSQNLFKSSFRHCLVGYKCGGSSFDFSSKVSNNLIFGQESKLPRQIYDIAGQMVPASRKIELFSGDKAEQGWVAVRHSPMNSFLLDQIKNQEEKQTEKQPEQINNTQQKVQLNEPQRYEHGHEEPQHIEPKATQKREDQPIKQSTVPQLTRYYITCQVCKQQSALSLIFKCQDCKNLTFCTSCLMDNKIKEFKKGHDAMTHKVQVVDPKRRLKFRCEGCGDNTRLYQCEMCFGLFLCAGCLEQGYKSKLASHVDSHPLIQLF